MPDEKIPDDALWHQSGVDPAVERMWKELIEARLRAQFYDALDALAAAGCDEDAVFNAGCEALCDLLTKVVDKSKTRDHKK